MVQKTREAKAEKSTEVEELTDKQLKAAQQAGKASLESIEDINIDEILAEIDDVLEENAEEFVQNFVQRGGQ